LRAKDRMGNLSAGTPSVGRSRLEIVPDPPALRKLREQTGFEHCSGIRQTARRRR